MLMAAPNQGTGTEKFETHEIGSGSGLGGHIPHPEWLLRAGRHLDKAR